MALRRAVGAVCASRHRYIRRSLPLSFSIPIPYIQKQSPTRPPAVDDSSAYDVDRISELLSHDAPETGFDLEKALEMSKIKPSPNLWLHILNRFGSSSKSLLTLLNWLQKRPGFEFSMEVFNAMIDSLGKVREFESAWCLILDHIQEDSSRRPDFDSFAIMIRRYTRVGIASLLVFFVGLTFSICYLSSSVAIDAFLLFERYYSLIDSGLYRAAIRTYEYACTLDLFNDFESQMNLLEVLLDTLCKGGHFGIASQYVATQRVKDANFLPSIRMYEILLNGCFLSRKHKSAEQLWMQMEEENVKPTVVTYGIFIEGLCRMHRLEMAMEMVEHMKKEGLELNAMVYNPIIDSLGEACRFKEALGMLERFSILENGPTEFTYNSLLKHFCKAGDLVEACNIVRMMIRNKCLPSSVTYSYFFKHLSKEGMVDLSMKLYTKLIRSGYEPDSLSHNAILIMLCEDGNIDLAKQISQDMRARGLDLDLKASIMLFQLLCRFRAYAEAVSEFKDMLQRGHIPPQQMYRMIIKDLEKEKMFEMVKKLDRLMLSVHQSTGKPYICKGSDDSSHERVSYIIAKVEAISDMVKNSKNPRALVERRGSENAVITAKKLTDAILSKAGSR